MRSNWKVVVALATVSAVAVCVTAASAGTQATTRFAATSLVPRVGTGGPQTGDFTPTGDEAGPMEDEFPGEPEDDEGDEGPEAFNEFRRTGVPDLDLAENATQPDFPQRLLYPPEESLYNPDNFPKGVELLTPVWWSAKAQ